MGKESDPTGQDATLVTDDISGADHGAGSAGQALIGEDKGTVFRYLDSGGGAGLFTQATADTSHITHMEATGILVGAENHNGVGLHTEVDNTLCTSQITGTAPDALTLVNLGYTVGIEGNGTETAHIDTSTATGTAVMAQVGAVFLLLGSTPAVAVDTGDLLGEFFLNKHT